MTRDIASGGERILARGVTRDEQEGFAQMDLWPGYAFTPDGTALVFSNNGKLTRLEVASGKSSPIPFTAKVEQWLAPRVAWQEKVELLARSQIHYTPTLLVAYGGPWGELYFWQTANPHDEAKLNRFVPHRTLDVMARRHPWINPEEYHFPTVAKGAAEVVRAGGKVSLGAHGQLQGLGVHPPSHRFCGRPPTARDG